MRIRSSVRVVLTFPLALLLACGPQASEDREQQDTEDTKRQDTAQQDSEEIPTDGPLNVLLVLVDTLRADHMQSYGYERETTPNLLEWSEKAVVFDQALSQAAWTVPSVSSILTGLYATSHKGWYLSSDLPQAHITLAELFQTAGYQTQALVKSIVVTEEKGFAQGFSGFSYVAGPNAHLASAEGLTNAAIGSLRTLSEEEAPFFLYLHYMDPHSDYIAPDPWYGLFDSGVNSDLTGLDAEVRAFVAGEKTATQDDIQRLLDLYDGEIAYWDHQFGRLLDHLEKTGLDKNTVVVLMADHGEAFFEHGQWFHGDLYQENLRVPLMVSVPGIAGRRVTGPVQTIDVTPTLAGLCGLETVAHWQARDLGEALLSGETPDLPVYFEHGTARGLLNSENLKLYVQEDGYRRLYDLNTDPAEMHNLNRERPEDLEALYAVMLEVYGQALEVGKQF
jgi:arylsulfatase A-like enzyme